MEINCRQAKYIQMLFVVYTVQGDMGFVFDIGKPQYIHILCTGGWQGPWPSWIWRTRVTKVSSRDWWVRVGWGNIDGLVGLQIIDDF